MAICCLVLKVAMKKRSRSWSAPRNWTRCALIIKADIGFAYYLAGRYDAALQDYQNVATTNPNFVPVHFYLSQYYRQKGEYDLWLKEIVENDRLAGLSERAQALQQLYARWRLPGCIGGDG